MVRQAGIHFDNRKDRGKERLKQRERERWHRQHRLCSALGTENCRKERLPTLAGRATDRRFLPGSGRGEWWWWWWCMLEESIINKELRTIIYRTI